VPRRFNIENTPAARKPQGPVMEPRFLAFLMSLVGVAGGQISRGFRKAAHHVHALHRLAAGPFDEVVQGV